MRILKIWREHNNRSCWKEHNILKNITLDVLSIRMWFLALSFSHSSVWFTRLFAIKKTRWTHKIIEFPESPWILLSSGFSSWNSLWAYRIWSFLLQEIITSQQPESDLILARVTQLFSSRAFCLMGFIHYYTDPLCISLYRSVFRPSPKDCSRLCSSWDSSNEPHYPTRWLLNCLLPSLFSPSYPPTTLSFHLCVVSLFMQVKLFYEKRCVSSL